MGTRLQAARWRELLDHVRIPARCDPGCDSPSVARELLFSLRAVLPSDHVLFHDNAFHINEQLAGSDTMPEDFVPEIDCGDESDFFDVCDPRALTYAGQDDLESVTRLSDDYSLREWRQSKLYLCLRPFGAYDRELMVLLPSPSGHARIVRFIRFGGCDFDENERALAALIRPHLTAHLHAGDLACRKILPLTSRQRQLMSLVAVGLCNKQIARILGISADTVRTHLQQIYARLGVNSRGEAVALLSPPAGIALRVS